MRFEVKTHAICQFPNGYEIPLADFPDARDHIMQKMQMHGLDVLPEAAGEIDVATNAELRNHATTYLAQHAPTLVLGAFYAGDYWVVRYQLKWYTSYRLLHGGAPLEVAVGPEVGAVNLMLTLALLP